MEELEEGWKTTGYGQTVCGKIKKTWQKVAEKGERRALALRCLYRLKCEKKSMLTQFPAR